MVDDGATTQGSTVAAPNTKKKKHRKWPWVILTFLVVIVVLAWFGANIYVDQFIATHGKNNTPVGTSPFANSSTVTYSGSLHAWYAPPVKGKGKPTVIIVHGYGANRTDHAEIGVALQHAGYGVMAIDLGYEKAGHNYGGGVPESKDVEAAVTFALAHGSKTVVLLGYSAGGTESILAAANGGHVAAVVADSSPVSFIHLGSDKIAIPEWLFAPASWFYGIVSSGGSLGSLGSLSSSYNVPTLVIQGSADKTVKPSNGPAVAKDSHGTLWAVHGVGHTKTNQLCPAQYLSQLETFYNDALSHTTFVLKPAC